MYNCFLEKIRNCKLSKTEARIAEYIAGNLNEICFMTASDLANKLKTSDTSVIRLSRSLGFRGFSDMQRTIQELVTERLDQKNDGLLSPLEKLTSKPFGVSTADTVTQFMDTATNNIHSAVTKNNLELYMQAVETICNAESKYVFGFRGCLGLAEWLSLLLRHMLPNVKKETSADARAIETMLDVGEKDCVILFSFHRYSLMANKVAKIALERKAKLIVFTENYTSPVAQGADHVFITDVASQNFFNSHVGVFFAVELLLTLISEKTGTANVDRLRFIEEHLKEIPLY